MDDLVAQNQEEMRGWTLQELVANTSLTLEILQTLERHVPQPGCEQRVVLEADLSLLMFAIRAAADALGTEAERRVMNHRATITKPKSSGRWDVN